MDQIPRRCLGAAAALTVSGMVAAITAVSPSLPDVQVRDFDLTASLVPNIASPVETFDDHVQPDLAGTGDLSQPQLGLGDLVLDHGAGSLNGVTDPSANFSDLSIDQNLLNNLLGGGFDANAIHDSLATVPGADAAGFDGSGLGGAFGANDQGTANVANAASAFVYTAAQGLPAAYTAFTQGVASLEGQLNSALVEAQAEALDKLLPGSVDSDIVNGIFHVNNTVLAHNEDALNSLLGVSAPDAIQSLLSGFGGANAADATWNTLMTLGPSDFTSIVNAVQADNLIVLLGSLSWTSLFPGMS